MKFGFLILLLFCSGCAYGSGQNFSLSDNKCLSSFRDTKKVGDILVKIYHPPNVSYISFSSDHTITFPGSTRIVSIFLVFKENDIKLARFVFCDLEDHNSLKDSFYHNKEGEWVNVEGEQFYLTFNQLANNIRKFKLNDLSEKWYGCHKVSNSTICTIEENYFVDKILLGNKKLWDNKKYLVVNSIGLTIHENLTQKTLILKIYYDLRGQNQIIEKEFQLDTAFYKVIKNSIEKRVGTIETQSSPSEGYSFPDPEPPKKTQVISISSQHTSSASSPQSIVERLKNVKLDFDEREGSSGGYTIKKEIALELDCINYQPKPGVSITFVRDGKTILWDSDDNLKTFLYCKFYLKGNSPILLVISYQQKGKSCCRTTTTTINEYFIKKPNCWYTLTNESFQEELAKLSSDTFTDRINSGMTVEEATNIDMEDVPEPPKAFTGIRPRLNITLELDSDYKNNYIVSNFLMDGLQTYYYEPKSDATVKFVKDGKNTVWSSDNNKRIMKYAKFCYKDESPVFLSVLFSLPSEIDDKTKQPVKKLDYFIKRDQWYHSNQEDFERLLRDLINRVTMRDRILNEKIPFDEHIKGLNIRLLHKEKKWYDRVVTPRPKEIPLTPFEYDINDDEDAKQKFSIEVNLETKFFIYTPKNGTALTRLKDGDRVIWYQECDGMGCMTLYMDLSGNVPLIHLIIDDPLDTHKYYKKFQNNWHLIEKDEYDEIREEPKSTPSQSDFTRVYDDFTTYIVVYMIFQRMGPSRSKMKLSYIMTIWPSQTIKDIAIFHYTSLLILSMLVPGQMISKLYLVILFTVVKNVYSTVYLLDLNDSNYKNMCHQLKTTGSFSQCIMRFKTEDSLDIYEGSKLIWTSKGTKLIDIIISSKNGISELFQVSYKDVQKDEVVTLCFYREEEGFSEIDPEIYHVLLSVMRDPTRNFDVNILSSEWFTTVDQLNYMTHYINQGYEVGNVIDGKNVIWNNSSSSVVTALKIKYTDYGPQHCEIYIRNTSYYDRLSYDRDDLGWHFINADRVSFARSNLDPRYVNPTGTLGRREGRRAIEYRTESLLHGTTGVPRSYDPNELVISLGDWSLANKPSGVNVGSYTICGFETRVYNIQRTRITRVTDGMTLIWRKVPGLFLHKVTLSKSEFHDDFFVELAITMMRHIELPIIKRLKFKSKKNIKYTDYLHFYKRNGTWIPMSRVDYLNTMNRLVEEYVRKNPDKMFDDSTLNFFRDVTIVPPETLKIKRRIDTSGFCAFFYSLYLKLFKKFTQVAYDLENSPLYLFDVAEHSMFSSFKCMKTYDSYALIKLLDGQQVIWAISEDGMGCTIIYYFVDGNTNLLHLVIDAKHEKDKYYERRREYWYPIEGEEFLALMNEKVKEKKGRVFSYHNGKYELVTEEEYKLREEERKEEDSDESEESEESEEQKKEKVVKKKKKGKKEEEEEIQVTAV